METDYEINHAISYAHYVACLPLTSPYLARALPRLKNILSGLLAQGSTPASESSPSSSSDSNGYSSRFGTLSQARLCEGLLKALIWVSWANPGMRAEIGAVIDGLLHEVATMMRQYRSISESESNGLR